MEKYLRLAASKHRCSQTRVSSTVTGIDEDNDWIRCEYSDASGCQRSIRSKFLVGADGKTGYVRKKYLEPKGVNLVRSSG
jgi:2-polyprenyl-6-methoxyphenol hydroxylase-like FAD-dependent oxidoreductase